MNIYIVTIKDKKASLSIGMFDTVKCKGEGELIDLLVKLDRKNFEIHEIKTKREYYSDMGKFLIKEE